MGKIEKRLHLWMHEVITNLKSLVDSITIRLKAKYILGHVTQGQENVRRKGYCVIIIKKYCFQLIICNNYILNKISFNRNTQKARLFIDWLMKML